MLAADIVTRVLARVPRTDLTSTIAYYLLNELHTELQSQFDWPFCKTSTVIMFGSGTGQPSVTASPAWTDTYNGFNWTVAALPINCKKITRAWDTSAGASGGISNTPTKNANRIMNRYGFFPQVDRDVNSMLTESTYGASIITALDADYRNEIEKADGDVAAWTLQTHTASCYGGVWGASATMRHSYVVADTFPTLTTTNYTTSWTALKAAFPNVNIGGRKYLIRYPGFTESKIPFLIINYYRFLGDYGATTLDFPAYTLVDDPFSNLAPDLMLYGTLEKVWEHFFEPEMSLFFRQKKTECLISFLDQQGLNVPKSKLEILTRKERPQQ